MSVTAGMRRLPLLYQGLSVVDLAIKHQFAALGLTLTCFSLFLHDWAVEFHVAVTILALAISLISIIGIVADASPVRLVSGIGAVALAGAMWTLLGSATAAGFGAARFCGVFGLISGAMPPASLTAPLLAHQGADPTYFVGLTGLAIFVLLGTFIGSSFRHRRPARVDDQREPPMPVYWACAESLG